MYEPTVRSRLNLNRDQHQAVARELARACRALRRAWLISGVVAGPLTPYGEAVTSIRAVAVDMGQKFHAAFPGERNPYDSVHC